MVSNQSDPQCDWHIKKLMYDNNILLRDIFMKNYVLVKEEYVVLKQFPASFVKTLNKNV